MKLNHIIHAYQAIDNGTLKPIEVEAWDRLSDAGNWYWVHLNAEDDQAKVWLNDHLNQSDHLVVDALFAKETRPRMVQVDDGVMLILRGVNLNENADPEDMVSIRLWITAQGVVSVQMRELRAVKDIVDKIEHGKSIKSSGDFVYLLISQLFQRLNPTLAALDDLTDDTEEKVLDTADVTQRDEIVRIRKQAIMIRRYIAPQRDAISQLRHSDASWLNEKHDRQILECLNDVTRYIEDLDAVRERAQIIKDELQNILADRLNKNMYVLSVIAAIFLPLGFLTGLLGINIGGIPGAEFEGAFWLFVIFLVALVGIQIWLFRKYKWF